MKIAILERLKLFKLCIIGWKIGRSITENFVNIYLHIFIFSISVLLNFSKIIWDLRKSLHVLQICKMWDSVSCVSVRDLPGLVFYQERGENCPGARVLDPFRRYHARYRLLFHAFQNEVLAPNILWSQKPESLAF